MSIQSAVKFAPSGNKNFANKRVVPYALKKPLIAGQCVGVLMIIALSFLVFARPETASAQTVDIFISAPDVTVEASATSVTVPILIESPDSVSVGGLGVQINYDTSILSISSGQCVLGNIGIGFCDTNTAGQVSISTISITPISDGEVAQLTFSIANGATGTTVIDVEVVEISEGGFVDLLPRTQANDGSITIEGGNNGLLGDVNCDNDISAVDALFILQHNVGLRADSGGCPLVAEDTLDLSTGDVNNNGDVDAVDALFILQCEVGLNNVFCPAADSDAATNSAN